MKSLAEIYRPITAAPFQNSGSYTEISPCDALKPYIRCFWGTKEPVAAQPSSTIVIPDTCMDIIFYTDYTDNRIDGCLCVIDERSFNSSGPALEHTVATFAIRFYAWAAILFSEQDFTGRKNAAFPVEEFFGRIKAELEPMLIAEPTLTGKIAYAEKALMRSFCPARVNPDLMNAVNYMLRNSGRARLSEVCLHTAVSERQLERIFKYNMGVSPKSFSSLLRYQLLWQEIVRSGNINALDLVEKYGYSDQSHLINDFRRRHLMTMREAVEYAYTNR